ncbi:MAG: amidohydrolase [Bacteroidales bacterium]|nr:amidohydrolase [Bacteroidales bacterium]
MGSILIKDILLDGRRRNVLIAGKRFQCLDAAESAEAETVIDGRDLALLPGLYNTHTHAPMTLLRGYGDDNPLEVWLHDYVWPSEAGFNNEDIRRGYDIAAREMVRTGTVFFNEMYFGIREAVDAVVRSGLRACIGLTVLEGHPLSMTEEDFDFLKEWQDPTGGRIQWAVTPHALYTVGPDLLKWTAQFAQENGLLLHTHLAETRTEVDNCVKDHGMRPVAYLDSLGLLGPNTVVAHCVHVNDQEADLLAERQVTISHCPCSNMKLGSGIFPYERLIKAGCRITLGTDGASSSNNLDLREAMKFAALLAKVGGNPQLLPSSQIFDWATRCGAEAFGIDAGVIAEGKLADCILVDLENVKMQPCHDLISNFVYSADSSCIAGVICDGHILYQR